MFGESKNIYFVQERVSLLLRACRNNAAKFNFQLKAFHFEENVIRRGVIPPESFFNFMFQFFDGNNILRSFLYGMSNQTKYFMRFLVFTLLPFDAKNKCINA